MLQLHFFFFFTKVPQIISKLSWRGNFAQLLFVVFLYSIVVCIFAYNSAKINLNFDWKHLLLTPDLYFTVCKEKLILFSV